MIIGMFPVNWNLNRTVVVLWGCLVSLLLPREGWSQPPPNDSCVSAEEIPASGPFPHLGSFIADLRLATSDGDPPASCVGGTSNSVWYSFTPAETGLYVFSTGADTATTVNDTVLSLYLNSEGCDGTFEQVACNDDEGDLRAGIAVELVAGETYYLVAAAGLLVIDEELTALEVRISKPEVPENDECRSAQVIPSAGPFPYFTEVVDTMLATDTGDPSPICGPESYRGVWYEFTPAETAFYRLSTCGEQNETSLFDSLMVVYAAPEEGCDGFLQLIDCEDDTCGNQPEIQSLLTAGVTYYILLWDVYFEDPIIGETRAQIEVRRFDPAVVTTLTAEDISSGAARLRGEIDPNGIDVLALFEWGETSAYGNSLPITNVVTGEEPLSVVVALSGFTPGAAIHYRVVATNLLGRVEGEDVTFQWINTRPIITGLLRRPDGTSALAFDAVAGQVYQVQGADDEFDWATLGAGVDEGDGAFSFIDEPGPLRVRYYRVLAP